jgi:hypothetical protein
MDGNDLDGAGKACRRSADDAGRHAQTRRRKPRELRRADVAAEDGNSESESRAPHHEPEHHAGDDAESETPVHVEIRERAYPKWCRNGPAGRFQGLSEVADGPADEMIEHRDGNVVEEQGRDRLVHSAPEAQRSGKSDPDTAGERAGKQHENRSKIRRHPTCAYSREHCREPADNQCPLGPMTSSPARAGMAVHSAVSISGAASVSVASSENNVPNAPRYRTR